MPATEQTWRNQPLLHKLFAVSGVALLIATIWMFLADHTREWKGYQRTARDIDIQMTQWRELQFQTQQAVRERDRLRDKLLEAQSRPIDPRLLDQFKSEVKADAKRRKAAEFNFAASDALSEELAELSKTAITARQSADSLRALARQAEAAAVKAQAAAQEAQTKVAGAADKKQAADDAAKARAEASEAVAEAASLSEQANKAEDDAKAAETAAKEKRTQLLDRLRAVIADAKFREDKLLNDRKFLNGELDAAKANLGLAIRDGLGEKVLTERQKTVNDKTERLTGSSGLSPQYESASDFRKQLLAIITEVTAEEEDAAKKLKDNQDNIDRLEKAVVERRSTYFVSSAPFLGKKWLELPILDAFNSPLKIDNLWDDQNTIDYNFRKVRRFDRCTTCHQAIEKTMPGSAVEGAFPEGTDLEFILRTPAKGELPKPELDENGQPRPLTVEQLYGIRLAGEGQYLLDPSDVTVAFVQPYSPPGHSGADPAEASAGDGAGNVSADTPPNSLGAQARMVVSEASRKKTAGQTLRHKVMQGQGHLFDEPEADQGLMTGDVIVRIGDDVVTSRSQVTQTLLAAAGTGQPLRLQVRRGLPSPYTSHPRLDLYLGSISPHKLSVFACTICHEGQGSATAFKFASHTPDGPEQRNQWSYDHGWYDNHHWIFPMFPARFVESSCLKCHHEVVELEPSERYPDPPAPKLVHGYQLVRKFGCYGCHEINGYDGPIRRVGPDLRLEPNYFAAAQQLQSQLPARSEYFEAKGNEPDEAAAPLKKEFESLQASQTKLADERSKLESTETDEAKQRVEAIDKEVAEIEATVADVGKKLAALDDDAARVAAHRDTLVQIRQLSEQLIHEPTNADVRHRLHEIIELDKASKGDKFGTTLATESHKLGDVLKDIEAPGDLRKVGPSLRYVANKLDPEFLYDWIREPKNFRASTRMPQFFGLWKHLESSPSLADAKKFEPVEILAIATYLRERSQAFDYLEPPAGISESTAEERSERGKKLFETRGCLACHNHNEFPDVKAYRRPGDIVQGPDLSGVGAKFSPERNPNGRKWLYSWIKQPSRYHVRTAMPDLFLDPIQHKDDAGEVTMVTDPVADIVEFLLTDSTSDWKPKEPLVELDAATSVTLNRLALDNLRESNSERVAIKYLAEGIPADVGKTLKGAEVELVGDKVGDQEKLLYIGRKTIGKYGCYACHDIPGFEDAKPIGTSLADWGRKESARLAFEHIGQYLEGHGHAAEPHAANEETTDAEIHAAGEFTADDRGFYAEAMAAGNRTGFIYQKLSEPRSYDYHKTENKRYNEWLRMPQFPLSDEDREAVITFVLGLVADPPSSKFVFQPTPRTEAIVQGRKVIEKFNCAGCHLLQSEKWEISYQPGAFGSPPNVTTFPFLSTHYMSEEVAAATTPDHQGLLHATLAGLPAVDNADGLPLIFEPSGDTLYEDDPYDPTAVTYSFDLWKPVLLDGQTREVGVLSLNVPAAMIDKQRPAEGGVLAKYLVPQFKSDAGGKSKEAWAWVPPPLVGEGKKVQPNWLHDFLLDPHPIRPAVVLRMPKFNMSSDEASKLVNYFAAVDNADYPYEFENRRRDGHLNAAAERYAALVKSTGEAAEVGPNMRFDHVMNIVTGGDGCVKCHLVGDFEPKGADRAKAPNLAKVYARIRPEYMRRWIARPQQILPYTAMPENIKYDPTAPNLGGVKQELYHGTSVEQLDGLVDLLMNFDRYTLRQTSVADLVKANAPPLEAAPEGADAVPDEAAPASEEE